MASSQSCALVIIAFALFFQAMATIGSSIECEKLKKESCAFAVSSSGKRCLLEKHVKRNGFEAYSCHTSEIEADKLTDWIETGQCLKACNLTRNVFGISSDSLLDSCFTRSLCAPQCYNNCHNIVDLYFNLAAAEGIYLPKLCKTLGEKARREMAEKPRSRIVKPKSLWSLSDATVVLASTAPAPSN